MNQVARAEGDSFQRIGRLTARAKAQRNKDAVEAVQEMIRTIKQKAQEFKLTA